MCPPPQPQLGLGSCPASTCGGHHLLPAPRRSPCRLLASGCRAVAAGRGGRRGCCPVLEESRNPSLPNQISLCSLGRPSRSSRVTPLGAPTTVAAGSSQASLPHPVGGSRRATHSLLLELPPSTQGSPCCAWLSCRTSHSHSSHALTPLVSPAQKPWPPAVSVSFTPCSLMQQSVLPTPSGCRAPRSWSQP